MNTVFRIAGAAAFSLVVRCAFAEEVVNDPHPAGPINYINPDVPTFAQSEYPGDYYDAVVPATLDLAERGRLAMNALTGMLNPECDYEIYMLVRLNADPPVMIHSMHDLQTLPLPSRRIMIGIVSEMLTSQPVASQFKGTLSNNSFKTSVNQAETDLPGSVENVLC